MIQKKVAIVVGSLRKESFNRKIANVLMSLAVESLSLEIVEIGDLQMYNQDLDENPPENWTKFRDKIKSYDAVLFVSPEYNRSVPGVLKNAIDIGSRPPAKNVWNQKPAAVVTVSPGAAGGFGSHHHLRQILVGINMPAMPQPEICIGSVTKLFDDKNVLVESTREFLHKFLNAFSVWIDKNLNKVPN